MYTCIVCGKNYLDINTSKYPMKFCSYTCYEEYNKLNKTPNCKCEICGKDMYMKPYRLSRLKHNITCSKECCFKLKSIYSKGDGNHQYGLIGDLNKSFKNKDLITSCGYILEYCPGHPYPHDKSTKGVRVLQHRLVVERNHDKFDDIFFEEIDGFIVLKRDYIVHHKDGNKQNNSIENLQILTESEHQKLHSLNKEIIRDNKTGRIIGVSKSDKHGGTINNNNIP